MNKDRSTRAVTAPQAIGPADGGATVCRLYAHTGDTITYSVAPNGNAAGVTVATVALVGPDSRDEDLTGGVTLNVTAIVGTPAYRMIPCVY